MEKGLILVRESNLSFTTKETSDPKSHVYNHTKIKSLKSDVAIVHSKQFDHLLCYIHRGKWLATRKLKNNKIHTCLLLSFACYCHLSWLVSVT